MNMNDIVSIITPMFNSSLYIKETINSVLKQTYIDWEMIIIDDCSTDSCVKIVKKHIKNETRIKLIELNSNYGPSYARNIGIKKSTGRFLAFLDSDDVWKKSKLEKQINFMVSNQYNFSFTGYDRININGDLRGVVIPNKKQVTYYDLLKTNHIGCLTAMLDLKKINQKLYMPNIGKRQDHAFWLKILKIYDNAYCLQESLAKYRIRNGSISNNKIYNLKYQWNLYRRIEKINFNYTLIYMCYYIIFSIARIIKSKYNYFIIK